MSLSKKILKTTINIGYKNKKYKVCLCSLMVDGKLYKTHRITI